MRANRTLETYKNSREPIKTAEADKNMWTPIRTIQNIKFTKVFPRASKASRWGTLPKHHFLICFYRFPLFL